MIRTLGIAFLLTTLAACSTAPPEPAPVPAGPAAPVIAPVADRNMPIQRCFRSVATAANGSAVDTMLIDLTIAGEVVFGRMDWIPGGKGNTLGVLNGRISNDTIYATYDNVTGGVENSEKRALVLGPQSVSLLRADLVERGGKWVLKDPASAAVAIEVPDIPCP